MDGASRDVTGSLFFRLLGPVSVERDGVPLDVGSHRRRAVLAMLLLEAGTVVSADRLVDALWGSAADVDGTGALWSHVSRLRSTLEPDRPPRSEGSWLHTRGTGYVLELPPGSTDVQRFEDAVTDGRAMLAGDPERARGLLTSALALWRGRALEEFEGEPWAEVDAQRLEQRRLDALELRFEADLACGLAGEVVAELDALVRRHPLRTRFVALSMSALADTGRRSDALDMYRRHVSILADEYGLDPAASLRRVRDSIVLDGEPLSPGGRSIAGQQSVTEELDEEPPETPHPRPRPPAPLLPAGEVTFVFTDIEGSTLLLKRLGDAGPDAIELHNELLRRAWDDNNGHEVSTEGDSFFVVFEDPTDALRACADGQRLLAEASWPGGEIVRVRMGVHSGFAVPRGDNYISISVHQASRVMQAARGDQIVLTEAVADRVAAPVPGTLARLGRYRLRSFDEPMNLYRLEPQDREPDRRTLRATPAEGHNLVAPPTPILGRDEDVAKVVASTRAGALVTVVGPGGVGKTRLAVEVGFALRDAWPDGIWLVELADLRDDSLVAPAIVEAVGAPSSSTSPPWDDAIAHLADRRALLVLDNAETHLDVVADLLPDLFARCPGVGVLATSREPIGVADETMYRLGPLAVPAQSAPVSEAATFASVRLFCDRARLVRPEFELDERTVGPVVGICTRVDGLPLATEIAAARSSVLGVEEILDGLEHRFRLLRSTARRLPERHRTMETVIDWSHRLLASDERTAFRRLSAFAGSFTVDAALAACADAQLAVDDVPESVWRLVDKSLVVADLGESGTRYRLLDSVRDYAALRLREAGETVAVASRLSAWLLEHAGPGHRVDRRWIARVGTEAPNFRGVIALLANDRPDSAHEMACVLGRFHDASQTFAAGIDELTRIAVRADAPSAARTGMLATLADLHLRRNDLDAASELVRTARASLMSSGPPPWDPVAVERTMGEVALRSGDAEQAVAIALGALERDLPPLATARMYNLLGIGRHLLGDSVAAARAFEGEIEGYAAVGDEARLASAHGNLAEVALSLGDRRLAARHQRESLQLGLALGQPVMVAFALIVAARFAAEELDWCAVSRLAAAAETHLDAAGHVLYESDRVVLDDIVARAAKELGDDEDARRRARGAALDVVAAAREADLVLAARARGDEATSDPTRPGRST